MNIYEKWMVGGHSVFIIGSYVFAISYSKITYFPLNTLYFDSIYNLPTFYI